MTEQRDQRCGNCAWWDEARAYIWGEGRAIAPCAAPAPDSTIGRQHVYMHEGATCPCHKPKEGEK